MFGLFKSSKEKEIESEVTVFGKILFQQISGVRDKAYAGILDKDDLKTRINSMYAAGYLIGYVDEVLNYLGVSESSKGKHANRVFEGIFPGAGSSLVKSKLAARRLGASISPETTNYSQVYIGCAEFDIGISTGQIEALKITANRNERPTLLAQYLTNGEIGEID